MTSSPPQGSWASQALSLPMHPCQLHAESLKSGGENCLGFRVTLLRDRRWPLCNASQHEWRSPQCCFILLFSFIFLCGELTDMHCTCASTWFALLLQQAPRATPRQSELEMRMTRTRTACLRRVYWKLTVWMCEDRECQRARQCSQGVEIWRNM